MMLEQRVRSRHEERMHEAATERLLRVEATLAPVSRLADRQSPADDTVAHDPESSHRIPA
jgi:hypothetical protein